MIHARKLVASSINLEQTFGRCWSPPRCRRASRSRSRSSRTWTGRSSACTWPWTAHPSTAAADFDPDVNQAWVVNVGYETPEDLNRHWEDVRSRPAAGSLAQLRRELALRPRRRARGRLHRPDSPLRALQPGRGRPRGLGPGGARTTASAASSAGARSRPTWTRARSCSLGDLHAARHRPPHAEHGPGRLDGGADRPGQHAGQAARSPSWPSTQTPVDHLYMCGATQHPHGFVTFAPAYNALQVIADDYGLERWWR